MFTKSLAWANKLAVAGQAYQPSKFEKRLFAFLTAMSLISRSARAQGAQGALESVQEQVISIVQIIFSIGLAIYLIVVVFKFFKRSPDAMESLGYFIGGIVIWFAFQLFKDDLVDAIGGGDGGVR
jgi:hypothetical protein